MSGHKVRPGHMYRLTKSGPVDTIAAKPDVWICRRVEDFPPGTIEALPTAGFAICPWCHSPIVFNTARSDQAGVEKACMQCMGITPDPYPT